MKKLLAVAALLLSSSVFANQFEGTWRTFDCVKRGAYYHGLELKFITGDFNHFGIIEQSKVKYNDAACKNGDEVSRTSQSFEYINLRPANGDYGIFNIDVKTGSRTVYDIIKLGRYRGVPHIFLGRGGPARTESRRPTSIDFNRRFGDASFAD